MTCVDTFGADGSVLFVGLEDCPQVFLIDAAYSEKVRGFVVFLMPKYLCMTVSCLATCSQLPPEAHSAFFFKSSRATGMLDWHRRSNAITVERVCIDIFVHGFPL